jgi:hypothetical protein
MRQAQSFKTDASPDRNHNPKGKNNAFEALKDDATGRFFSDWHVGQLWPVHTIRQGLE